MIGSLTNSKYMSEPSSPNPQQHTTINEASVAGQVSQAGRDTVQNQGQGTIYKDVTINNYRSAKEIDNAPLSRQEYLNRQALLNKVRNSWIKGVLEQSLYKKAKIELGLEQWFDVLDLAWAIPEQPKQSLPSGTRAIDKFDELGTGARTLLILGAPGAGKTTTLLELACDLLNRAEQDVNQSIPVVFNLSSWATSKHKLADWLVQELTTKYQVSKSLSRTWIQNQQLLLLLDGLDEVHHTRRNACVRAINEFSQNYGQTEMVVCSRIKDYEALSHRLQFQGAIFIQPLTSEQIENYLSQAGEGLTGVKTALRTDLIFQEFAQTPLMLSIMSLAYQDIPVAELPQFLNAEERRKHLFDAYIERMFSQRGHARYYSKAKALFWLSWLAQKMFQESQTIFLIERIHPKWLVTVRQKGAYIIASALFVGIIYGLIFGLGRSFSYGLSFKLNDGLSFGIVTWLIACIVSALSFLLWFSAQKLSTNPTQTLLQRGLYSAFIGLSTGLPIGLLSGLPFDNLRNGLLFIGIPVSLIAGLVSEPTGLLVDKTLALGIANPVTALRWSWASVRTYLVFWLSISLPFGLLLMLGKALGIAPDGLRAGFFIWMSGLIFGVLGGLATGTDVEKTTTPNQAIWQSAKTALSTALIGVLGLVSAAVLLRTAISVSVSEGLLAGWLLGGGACIVHLTLRLLFYCSKCMPWNYARFLDWTVDRLFLQKVGGGYIFVHRLLMEHFAVMESK